MRVVPAQNPTENGEKRLSLECLKLQGEAALNCFHLPGLKKIVLREVHLIRHNHRHQTLARLAPDVFLAYAADDTHELFPLDSTIIKAVFDFYYADSDIPRSLTIEPLFGITTERPADAEIANRWARFRGFISSPPTRNDPDEQTVEIA